MKKFFVVFCLLLLTACSGTGTIEKLKEDFPDAVKEVADSLPEKIQKELAVPTKLPFDVNGVKLSYAGNPSGDPKGEIIHTEFMYAGDDGNLHVTTYHHKNTSFSTDDKQLKTITLKDGTKAYIESDGASDKSIRWKKDGLYHSILLISKPKGNMKYTIEDLVKIANSMEY